MARWSDLATESPDLEAAARGYLDAHRHKTIATLRRDGSPRISGIEAFVLDGDLWFGAMWRSRKALDLRRDPRFALHSASEDPPEWRGDAKVSGRAIEVDEPEVVAAVFRALGADPPERSHLFRAEVASVSTVMLGEPPDHLVVTAWSPEDGTSRTVRR